MYYEKKLSDIDEGSKLFSYLETRQIDQFISLAGSTNLKISDIINKKGQSLMHVAAMVGNEEAALCLKRHHTLGENKDVPSSPHSDLGKGCQRSGYPV